MGAKQKPQQTPPSTDDQLVGVLRDFVDAVAGIDLVKLNTDVQSLTFDNERIVKPALEDIRKILGQDIYAPKSEVAELKAEIEKLRGELEKEKERTRNYKLVEKVVFSLVGLVLVAVFTALIATVVIKGGVK